ncbi:MAG: 2-C-methyl-D-erythritol 2,4-cyclodiphosphate synthase [Prevotellaceae bacterium]|jgi:2-C-methyl-D-erythritol 2,4-cyclodiphosphate synthase|nr:2-C-methyl-D-erythritol 2,4-cyclodiphosphate synthase [Prevotellaceae bacterium]
MIRIGNGYDVHKLGSGIDLWIGGIKIDCDKGAIAHSDGDALIHAICDALLGAAALKDIGHHFPDRDVQYKNIDSKILLRKTVDLLAAQGYSIVNIDSVVCLQKPAINPYVDEMQKCLAKIMNIDVDRISIKATTTEKLGFVGREEGIAAHAVALIEKNEQNKIPKT